MMLMRIATGITFVVVLTFAIAYATVMGHQFWCSYSYGVMERIEDEYGFVPKEMVDEWREDCEGKTWLELEYHWLTLAVGVIGIILVIVDWYDDRKHEEFKRKESKQKLDQYLKED